MNLRNKKTGEIVDTLCSDDITKGLAFGIDRHNGNPTMAYYNSLAELNEEWEDYEEDENFYVIGPSGKVGSRFKKHDGYEEDFEEIGNYFETKEEAEKAVEKLKVRKRLKDNGFKFETYGYDRVTVKNGRVNIMIKATFDEKYGEDSVKLADLDLLFGGEE